MKYTLVIFGLAIALLMPRYVQAQKVVFGPHVVDGGRGIYYGLCNCKIWCYNFTKVNRDCPQYEHWLLNRFNFDCPEDGESRFIAPSFFQKVSHHLGHTPPGPPGPSDPPPTP